MKLKVKRVVHAAAACLFAALAFGNANNLGSSCVDSAGNVYTSFSYYQELGGPTGSGVSKVNSSGSLAWRTGSGAYYGGGGGSLRVDRSGDVFQVFAYGTESGGVDVAVSKFSSSGSLLTHTGWVGNGSGDPRASVTFSGMALDSTGRLWIAWQTPNEDGPGTWSFLTTYDNNLENEYQVQLGNGTSLSSRVQDIVADGSGNVYVASADQYDSSGGQNLEIMQFTVNAKGLSRPWTSGVNVGTSMLGNGTLAMNPSAGVLTFALPYSPYGTYYELATWQVHTYGSDGWWTSFSNVQPTADVDAAIMDSSGNTTLTAAIAPNEYEICQVSSGGLLNWSNTCTLGGSGALLSNPISIAFDGVASPGASGGGLADIISGGGSNVEVVDSFQPQGLEGVGTVEVQFFSTSTGAAGATYSYNGTNGDDFGSQIFSTSTAGTFFIAGSGEDSSGTFEPLNLEFVADKLSWALYIPS